MAIATQTARQRTNSFILTFCVTTGSSPDDRIYWAWRGLYGTLLLEAPEALSK